LEISEGKNLADIWYLNFPVLKLLVEERADLQEHIPAYGFKLELPASSLSSEFDLLQQLISSLPSVIIFLEIAGLFLAG